MPTPITLLDLQDVLRSIGRGVICYAEGVGVAAWEPGTEMDLVHLGDTEGDISLSVNSEVSGLTLPEVTGPARHNANVTGENPVLTAPLFLADPDLLDVVTPTGSRHGGQSFRRRAKEYTLAIFPENLFLEPQADGTFVRKVLSFAAGVWTLDGAALDAEHAALLDMTIWLWRGYFEKAPRRFIGAPDGKNIETVTFNVLHHSVMPEGHQLYTMGDPSDFGIHIDGGS